MILNEIILQYTNIKTAFCVLSFCTLSTNFLFNVLSLILFLKDEHQLSNIHSEFLLSILQFFILKLLFKISLVPFKNVKFC